MALERVNHSVRIKPNSVPLFPLSLTDNINGATMTNFHFIFATIFASNMATTAQLALAWLGLAWLGLAWLGFTPTNFQPYSTFCG